MSKFSYQVGYALGTFTREFLREVETPAALTDTVRFTTIAPPFPPPCLSAQAVDELSQIPAVVRAKGIDLYQWYEANTRLAPKPTRKRRPRTTRAQKPATQAVGPVLGCLADLI